MWSRSRGICCRRGACSRSSPSIGIGCSRRSMFEDLFPSGRGRPSIPPDVVASVIVLQTLHHYSDREAADAVTFDLRWKAACGYAVDAAGFHPSTLTYWRRRLAASERPQRIFDAVREVITADRGAGREAAAGVGLHGAR